MGDVRAYFYLVQYLAWIKNYIFVNNWEKLGKHGHRPVSFFLMVSIKNGLDPIFQLNSSKKK